jgi:type I restriction enzyme M protein
MIDASKGFIKDGNKNRLREQDIHRIVDTFRRQADLPRYARLVPLAEIADTRNDHNLNLPRYIDSSDPEDLHDLTAHLRGGIPVRDLDDPASPVAAYWQVLPGLRQSLFAPTEHAGYVQLQTPVAELKAAIAGHPEFITFNNRATASFTHWRQAATATLRAFGEGSHPKALIETLAEDLLAAFKEVPLIDAYDVYQHLMDFWAQTMQDDAYLIAAEGWVAQTRRLIETDKKGKTKDRGWTCELIPKPLIVARFFAAEQAALDAAQAELDAAQAAQSEMEEEQGGEDGIFNGYDSITAAAVKDRIREIGRDPEGADELKLLKAWMDLTNRISALKKQLKDGEAALDGLAYARYPQLTPEEIRSLAIDDKWMAALSASVRGELDRVSQTLTGRLRELAERYATPLPQLADEVEALAIKVAVHLDNMGLVWS